MLYSLRVLYHTIRRLGLIIWIVLVIVLGMKLFILERLCFLHLLCILNILWQ